MIPRPALAERVRLALARRPVAALIGPRQCGKTTLARAFVPPESAAHPGSRRYALDRRIEVMPLAATLEDPGRAWRRQRSGA